MKHAIVGSLTALLAGAGLALAQQPDETLPPPRSAGSRRWSRHSRVSSRASGG